MVEGAASEAGRLPERFWLFLGGQALSELGSAFTRVALPLLVFRRTGSAVDLGVASAAAYLPWVLFGLPGGAVMDRVDRRRTMVGADLGRALAVAVLPALAAAGRLDLALVYAVVAVQGTLQVLFFGGETAAVVALVRPERRATANSRSSAAYSVAGVAGTSLAGLLVSVAPVADALWVDAASFAVSAATLGLIRQSFNESPPVGLAGGDRHGLLAELAADARTGLGYVRRHGVLRTLFVQLTLVNLFGSAVSAELALFAARRLGAGNGRIGALYAVSSAGVVLLSFAVAPLGRRAAEATVATGALVVYGLGIVALGLTTSYPVALACQAVVGGMTVLYNVSRLTLVQRIVPNDLLGRVTTIGVAFAWCAMPIGALGGGALVAATGRPGLVFAGAGAAIAALGLAGVPVLRGYSGTHAGGRRDRVRRAGTRR